mmetsp:Transcript_43759/g.102110  ORF Transcript_43759/g.102110 Transcript_43759/m.102110 type:complete len:244 (-) Transcript_43759:44-775(-)
MRAFSFWAGLSRVLSLCCRAIFFLSLSTQIQVVHAHSTHAWHAHTAHATHAAHHRGQVHATESAHAGHAAHSRHSAALLLVITTSAAGLLLKLEPRLLLLLGELQHNHTFALLVVHLHTVDLMSQLLESESPSSPSNLGDGQRDVFLGRRSLEHVFSAVIQTVKLNVNADLLLAITPTVFCDGIPGTAHVLVRVGVGLLGIVPLVLASHSALPLRCCRCCPGLPLAGRLLLRLCRRVAHDLEV